MDLTTEVNISHGTTSAVHLTDHPFQHTMFIPPAYPPDPSARQPLTVAAVLPLYACHYLLAVLAILPHTYVLRVAFVPVVLWQAWYCAVGLDFSAGVARSLGRDGVGRLNQWNYGYVVRDSFFQTRLSS